MHTYENIPPVFTNDQVTIRLHVDSPYTHFGLPYGSQANHELQQELLHADFVEETYYINNTYQPITIMNRNGLAVMIPSRSNLNSRDFLIRKILKLRNGSLESVLKAINAQAVLSSPELREIKDNIRFMDQFSYQGASILIDYQVSVEDLKAKGGTLYHYQTDLIVSFKDTVQIDAHPYSPSFLNIGTFGIQNSYVNQREFNLKLRYVNHAPTASPKYVNLFGTVFTLFPQRDGPSHRSIETKVKGGKREQVFFQDYVQVFYSSKHEASQENKKAEGVSELRLTLEEAHARFGLYDTYVEAVNRGDIELSRKEELNELNHQLELLKQQQARERVQADQAAAKRKEELDEKAHLLEMQRKELEDSQLKLKKDLNAQAIEQANLNNIRQELENKRKEIEAKLEYAKQIHEEELKRIREIHLHNLKMESERLKAQYDREAIEAKQKAETQKSITDFIKLILAVAGGLISAHNLWLKTQTGKSA